MAARNTWAPPKIAQLAFCTDDLPGSVRLYSEAFGFAPAGGNMVWGQWLADIQDLGEDAATAIAWLVGRQDLLQLEFFNHTLPRPRPLADDWRPSDLGWVRWGLTIPDFEPALDRLHGSDQGFMNIAVGTRVRAESGAIIEQVRAAGHRINAELPGVAAGGTYMSDGSGNSLEVICAPREFDSTFGFAPTPQLLRPPGWPSAHGRARRARARRPMRSPDCQFSARA